MDQHQTRGYTAFEGSTRIASGELTHVVMKAKEVSDRGGRAPVLVLDDMTSAQIEVDFRGTAGEVLQKLEARRGHDLPADASSVNETKAQRGPGRPKLGVVAREVTLLPRHWDWLGQQPGGASVALRKLVEQARRENADLDCVRQAQEAAYRFMVTMAGNERGFEDASRALFAGSQQRFHEHVESWPVDVRDHAKRLAASAFGAVDPA